MKLNSTILPLLLPSISSFSINDDEINHSCDLSGTGIFVQNEDGYYSFSQKYALRSFFRNPLSNEVLQNKAQPVISRATLTHGRNNTAEYSDIWVGCKYNKNANFLVKCYKNGEFEINGVAGVNAKLPSCEPMGCHPADLGPYNTKYYTESDGCELGYFEHDGNMMERHGNRCYRTCGTGPVYGEMFKSPLPIRCMCDPSTEVCQYMVLEGSEWISWLSVTQDGQPLIPTDRCPKEQMTRHQRLTFSAKTKANHIPLGDHFIWHGDKNVATYLVTGGQMDKRTSPSRMFDGDSRSPWISEDENSLRKIDILFMEDVDFHDLKINPEKVLDQEECRYSFYDICLMADDLEIACTPGPGFVPTGMIHFKDYLFDRPAISGVRAKNFVLRWHNYEKACVPELFLEYYKVEEEKTEDRSEDKTENLRK